MPQNLDDLPPDCATALEIHARAFWEPRDGAAADGDETLRLAEHLARCPSCRACVENAELAGLDGELRETFAHFHVTECPSPEFARRTMARLPDGVAETSPTGGDARATSPEPRVFRAERAPGAAWRKASGIAAAAAIALAALLAWILTPQSPRGTPPAQTDERGGTHAPIEISRGSVKTADGRDVQRMQLDVPYTVAETAVVPLPNAGLLKLAAGAQVSLRSKGTDEAPQLELAGGDVYAFAPNERTPVRLACRSFETDCYGGDFFVTEEEAGGPRGVLIVFTGMAEVSPRSVRAGEIGTFPLSAGQIFICIGGGPGEDEAYSSTLDLADVLNGLHGAAGTAGKLDVIAMRREYEHRIKGYQAHLKTIEQLVKTEQDAFKLAELRERYQRVAAYRDAHQRKLDSLRHELPMQQIERGINGHGDPAKWL